MSARSNPNETGAAPPVHAPDCLDCADADPRVVALLTATAARWPEVPHEIQARLAAAIPPALGRAVGRSGGGRLRRLMSRPVLLIAAAAAAVVLAMLVPKHFDGAQPAVAASYATALNALRSAQTLHIRDYRLNRSTGTLELEFEYWCSPGDGMRENGYPGPSFKLFTLNDVQWSVFPAAQVAVERSATRSADWFADWFAEKLYLRHADRAKHDPRGDTVVDGVRCRLFVATSDAVTTQPSLTPEEAGLVYLWVDPNGAVRRCEHHWFDKGTWTVVCREEVAFDVPIDPALFSTEFTKTYRIIEPEKVLTEMFDLARADATYEVNGGVVAFHNTVRLPGNRIATTVTLRPTKQLKEFLRTCAEPGVRYGPWLPLYLIYNSVGDPERPTRVAEVSDRDMHVIWLLLDPSPTVRSRDSVRVHLQINDWSDDHRLAKLAGLKEYADTTAVLPVANRPEHTADTVAEAWYDQIEQLALFRPVKILIFYGDPLSNFQHATHAQGCQGGLELRISREQFREAFVKAWATGD